MRVGPLLTCGWPGLSRAWYRGDCVALAVATGFAGLFNVAVFGTFIWPEFLSAAAHRLVWLGVAGFWSVGVWVSWRHLPSLLRQRGDVANQDLFIRAQGEYLRGNWFEVESLLNKLLALDADDVDAHLMRASLYRHTRRVDEAERQLRLVEQLQGAETWRLEIEQERLWLDRMRSEQVADPAASETGRDGGEAKPAAAIESGPNAGY